MALNIALVTGSSRGLGLGIVKALLARGSTVVATCRHPGTAARLAELSSSPRFGDRLHVVPMDVTCDDSVKNAADVVAKFGKLDLLVNNAGIAAPNHPNDDIWSTNKKTMMELYEVNCVGPLLVTQAFRPLLLKADQPKVVNLASSLGSVGRNIRGGSNAYRSSKAALGMTTATFAKEDPSVTYVAVCPGWVQTEMGNAGGRCADITVEESVASLCDVMASLSPLDSGRFMSHRGETIQW